MMLVVLYLSLGTACQQLQSWKFYVLSLSPTCFYAGRLCLAFSQGPSFSTLKKTVSVEISVHSHCAVLEGFKPFSQSKSVDEPVNLCFPLDFNQLLETVDFALKCSWPQV